MRMKRKGVVVVALLLLYRSPDASQAAKSKNMRVDFFPPYFDNVELHNINRYLRKKRIFRLKLMRNNESRRYKHTIHTHRETQGNPKEILNLYPIYKLKIKK